MAPEMPESGTEKGVEPRELSLTESGDTHVPLLSADPEKAKEEDTEDEKSRELRLNEDIRVRPNLVSNLCYAFAFFLGLCIAMFIFARDPHMGSTLAEKTPGFLHAAAHEVQRRSSWMVRQGKKLMGVQKPFLWMVWAEESSLESEEFLRRCVDRWHSSLSSDFEVHLVEAKHFDLWLNSSALPQNFGDLPPKVQEDILKVALLAHFGGVLVDVDSIPIQQDSMMQIWTSLQHSDAQALGTYSYHQECQWSLGMWFLAAKKGSAFMKHWLKLLLEEIGASAGHGLAVAISSRGGPDQGRSFSHPPRQIPLCLRPGDGRFPEKGEKGGGSRPDGAETFQKELRKDSDTLHQFIVNDSKVIAKESRVIAGATENAAHALRLGGTTMSTTTTTTTTTTSTTTSTLPDPVFVTLQTKGSSLLQKVGGPFEVVNIGAGKPWHGYKTKFELLLPFLKSKKDDDLVAFMDGTDIFWGGCEMKDFLHYYQQIVEASGASIVISAEIACGEQPCNKVPPAPEWAVNPANISLNDGFWQKYVSPKGCGSVGCPCASPPAIKFLNSGFIIGPVKDLLPMISWSLDNYDKESTLGDQSVLAKYWFANTDQIALDYQGALCLSTSDLNPYTLFAKDPITGGLWNKAFGRMQCLTHGNGRGRYALWDLLGRFSLGKHGERYAKALKFKKL